MADVVKFYATGGPEVLKLEHFEVPAPGSNQVKLKHHAIGLNFADTYFRDGTYPVPLPCGLGVEAAGTVEAVGADVRHLSVGDRVTYTGFINTLGAYSTERLIAADLLIKLPDDIPFDVAAATTMRGLTTAYLLQSLYPYQGGETILVYAAAGGVGSLMTQWAKSMGVKVIGCVSSKEKADYAMLNGCDYVINSSQDDIPALVKAFTDGRGVDVVYDSVGRATFEASLDSLKRRGLMVCMGTASGTVPPFDPQVLAMKGSLFLTRPALADYISDAVERDFLLSQLFGRIAAGDIKVEINQRFALSDAAEAHRALESRATTGCSILEP